MALTQTMDAAVVATLTAAFLRQTFCWSECNDHPRMIDADSSVQDPTIITPRQRHGESPDGANSFHRCPGVLRRTTLLQ